ncbi:N-acetylglucosaminyl-diphospho-decaprenol L-rhamnosyltransferase [bacterium HR30]|nr:N-acetylglucosaminyl-diphospho-decaprenol L-rhamnosyltransferase [bacterium HR30]
MHRPAETRPKVAVVVVNWNGNEDTLQCVESLERVDYPNVEIIVVDNGSRIDPTPVLQARFPTVKCLRLPRNLGFTGGNNAGIRYALDAGAQYVFVLNNDTVVEPDVLSKAVQVAEQDPRIAAVGVKILAWDDPSRIWVAYGYVTFRQGLVRLVGYYCPDDFRFNQERDVEWVPGTAMLLRRQALEDVGLFDDAYFAYHEDVDWCTTARRKGYRIVFAPAGRILHKGHGSSGGRGYVSIRQYLAGRNMVLYVQKHGNVFQRAKFTCFQLGTLPFQYLRRFVTGEQAGVILKVRGMIDALRDRPIPFVELGLREEEDQ